MKKKNAIKTDFFLYPEGYGFYYFEDLGAIWREIVEPDIIGKNTPIPNCGIKSYVENFRESFFRSR